MRFVQNLKKQTLKALLRLSAVTVLDFGSPASQNSHPGKDSVSYNPPWFLQSHVTHFSIISCSQSHSKKKGDFFALFLSSCPFNDLKTIQEIHYQSICILPPKKKNQTILLKQNPLPKNTLV